MKKRKNIFLWLLAISIYIAEMLALSYAALLIIVIAMYGTRNDEYENVKANDSISM